MKRFLTILVLAAAIPLTMSGQQRPASTASQPVYLDPSKPIDQRVDDLISKLTLEEKASLLGTTAPAIERLKVPVMNGCADWDGIHLGCGARARCRIRDRRRRPGRRQLLAHGAGSH